MDWPGTPETKSKWPGTPASDQAWPGQLQNAAPLHDRPAPLSSGVQGKLEFESLTPKTSTAVSQLSAMPRGLWEQTKEGVGEAFGKSRDIAQRGVAGMKAGNIAGGAFDAVRGTVGEAISPLVGLLLGPGQNFDPGHIPEMIPPEVRGVAGEAPKPPAVRPTVADIPKAMEDPRAAQAGQQAVQTAVGRAAPEPMRAPVPAKPPESPVAAIMAKRAEAPKPAEVRPIASHATELGKLPKEQIQPRMQAIVDDLRQRFGMTKPLPVSHLPMDKAEGGEARRISGEIRINSMHPIHEQLATLTHEFGHQLQFHLFDNLPLSERQAVIDAWKQATGEASRVGQVTRANKYRAMGRHMVGNAPVNSARDARAKRAYPTATPAQIKAGQSTRENFAYNASFHEWFANQVSAFLTTDKVAKTSVDRFFKGIADIWKRLWEAHTGRKGPTAEVDAFMRKYGDFETEAGKAPKPPSPHAVAAEDTLGDGHPVADTIHGRLSNELHKLDRKVDADKREALKAVRALPKEAVALKQKFFNYLEPGPGKPTLTREEKRIFNATLKPWLDEQRKLYENVKRLAPTLLPQGFDPNYVHHLVKGRTPEFDEPLGNVSNQPSNPYQAGGAQLPRTTRSLQKSRYYSIEDDAGNRHVVKLDDKGNLYQMWHRTEHNVAPSRIVGDVKPGEKFSIDGHEYTMGRASVAEKEAHTPIQYYKDAYAATIANVTRLRKVVDALDHFEKMKSDPEFMQDARRPGDNRVTPGDYRTTTLPGWEGWKFDPHIAEVVDDWHNKRKEEWYENLKAFNHAVVGAMFLTPFPHMGNVGAHWAVGRGWDWLSVPAYQRMAKATSAAIIDVLKQGPMTQELLEHGSAMMLPRVTNQNFYKQLLTGLGEQIKASPGDYANIATRLGMKPVELYQAVLKGSSFAMWAFNDILMQSRIRELMEKRGMANPTPELIREVEKDIPNYRVNSRVMMDNKAGRAASQFLQSSFFSNFGRYRNNQFRTIADMTRDLVKGTGKERFDAAGKVFALAALSVIVGSVVTPAIQALTGNKRDRASPKGPLASLDYAKKGLEMLAPQTLRKLGMTDEQVQGAQLLQSLLSLSPMLDETTTQVTGRDPYTGQDVKTSGERAQSLAEQVSPIGEASKLASGKVSPTEELLKQSIFGLRSTPKPPPSRIVKQEQRATAKREGQQPLNRMISNAERKLQPFTPDAIVNWLLHNGPSP